jgi:Ca2+-binding EF-hand superfamily protein
MAPRVISRPSSLVLRPSLAAAAVGLALLALAPLTTPADPPPRPADPGGADDVLDVLYLADARPYVFRLHILIDGQPYTARWAERVLKVFAFLDRDGDGVLTKEEVALAPSPHQMAQMFHGVPYTTTAFNDGSLFAEMDTDGDRKVTQAEFLNYYRRGEGGPAQLVGAPGRANGANGLTERLFQILDADHDGKLSKEELANAEAALHKYDANDDEIITADELMQAPTQVGVGLRFPVMQAQPPAAPMPLGDSPFLLVPREEAPKRITERLQTAKDLLARYDKDKDGKLSPAEIGVPKETFDRYDQDHDGGWNATELLRWMIFAPDVETVVHLGRLGDKDGVLDLVTPAGGAGGLTLNKGAINALSIGMSDAQISLIRAPGGVYGGLTEQVFQGYDQQFLAADKEDKRFLTRPQLVNGQATTLYQAFPIIDRDGDGRITEEEIREWVALATDGVGCVPTVSVADNGRALFELLDVNNDGRLTIRELRSAWKRLAPYDHGGHGAISPDEVPRQFQVSVLEAAADTSGVQQQFQMPVDMAQRPAGPPRIERGPLWFRKMDVNGDGDVSPREFLGSPEDFKRIDTDGDGLISAEEAEAFDAMMRAKKAGK